MFDAFRPGGSLAWDYLWQSTLFLCLGLGATALVARRPARAHRLLLLAMLGALVTPMLAQAARRGGWGLLTSSARHESTWIAPTSTASSTRAIADGSPLAAREPFATLSTTSRGPDNPGESSRIAGSHDLDPLRTASLPAQAVSVPDRLPPVTWRMLALGVWLILAVVAVGRLVSSLVIGLGVVRRSRQVKDEALATAAAWSAARLGVRQPPELLGSSDVDCPAIWCWGRRPATLLPEAAQTAAQVDWAGVFCHELAHWLRRDQWSSLLGELLIVALPWHPLAWWAKHRLGQFSELACDDWVLGTGLPAADYAESLLGLVPQRGAPLALAAVSSRRGLLGRIHHILDERRSSPVVGKRWACASAMAVVLAASALALAQSRPAVSKDQGAKKNEAEKVNASKTAPVSNRETTKKRTLRGTVLGPDGKPVAGATVFWIGHRTPPASAVALPKDQQSSRSFRAEVMAKRETDSSGTFALSADFDPVRSYHEDGFAVNLLVKAPGLGILSSPVKDDATEVTLRLAPEVVINGRLLTPGGTPAPGVRVTLDGFHNDQIQAGMFVGLTPTDEEIPSYWPQARTTDGDGRFTLEGVPQSSHATLTFWHPEHAVDEVTVNTTIDGSLTPGLRAFEITPVKPTFTHTLEPARPVQGRVTDKGTGKPLAGILVEMIPMRSHGGMPFHARTDADGRYRVSGHGGARTYITTVYPPADSGYLAASKWEQNWPAGAKFLEKNFALDKGRIVHGHVIDAATKRPITGAAVVYQPKRGNPNDRNYDLRNTVLTDSNGRFAITTLPGPGFLAVETPDESYIRVPVAGDSGERTIFPQGFAAIDVSKDGEPKPAEITVRKGVTLEAKAIGPDGKVVHELVGFCEGIDARLINVWNQGQTFADGLFRLPGADPARIYRVYLMEPEKQLGAVVDLKPDPRADQPIEVKLLRMAKVHGKVVGAGGSPMQGGQVYPLLVIRDKEGEMSRNDVFRNTAIYSNLIGQKSMLAYSEKQSLNSHGEFVIDTLLPGVRLYIMAAAGGGREAGVPVSPLEPGEDRDLGTITLKERQP